MSITTETSLERNISPGSPRPPIRKPRGLLNVKGLWRQYRSRLRVRKSDKNDKTDDNERERSLDDFLRSSKRPTRQNPFAALDRVALHISIDVEDEEDDDDERFLENPIGIGCSRTFASHRHRYHAGDRNDESSGANSCSSPSTLASGSARCSSGSDEIPFRMIDPFSFDPDSNVLVKVRSLSVDWSPVKNKAKRSTTCQF